MNFQSVLIVTSKRCESQVKHQDSVTLLNHDTMTFAGLSLNVSLIKTILLNYQVRNALRSEYTH